ncbi:LLM class flavin-dependent oxidoreductase [Micromonospora sp. NPDC005171]|uniref:LLM class flavin-dependent oxidoreductase n=1 Tax=Micromonospora sp. NPDC005171 TaxID=3156866 RepID=UPI0033B9C543
MTARTAPMALLTVPEAAPRPDDGPQSGFRRVAQAVRDAEQAGVDAVLLEDDQAIGGGVPARGFEASTLAAALAVTTSRIGLVVTISTEHLAPYHVARRLASIDYLSGGRAGWLADSPEGEPQAANYHRPPGKPAADDVTVQRARAAEFADVLAGLWDSFSDDAFLRDRESGVYFRTERLRQLDHKGEHFDVAGPLNIGRPPQGCPVLVRRLSGPADVTFAGTRADVAIVAGGDSADLSQIRTQLRLAAGTAGRPEGAVLLLLDVVAGSGPGADADRLRELFDAGLVDGFVLRGASAGQGCPVHAAGADDQVHALVDTLRPHQAAPVRSGSTLRDRLGLPRPPGRWT